MLAFAAYEWGTAASVMFTAAIGYFSFRTAERAARDARAEKTTSAEAVLQAEEIAGWKALIATSRAEYEAAVRDRAELRLELGRTQGELKGVQAHLDAAESRVREMEKEIALLHAIIGTRRDDRLSLIETRLDAEELRNTDIESLAAAAGTRADVAERRADDAEHRADEAHDRADDLEQRTLEPDPSKRRPPEH